MTIIVIILLLTNIITGAGLYLSSTKALSMLEKLEETEEALEKCYASLKTNHDVLEEKTKIEVFSDEPVVKEIVAEMYSAKQALLDVINVLQEYSSKESEVTIDEEKEIS